MVAGATASVINNGHKRGVVAIGNKSKSILVKRDLRNILHMYQSIALVTTVSILVYMITLSNLSCVFKERECTD